MIKINDDLQKLQKAFNQAGFDIRIVGGAVRDSLIGIEPKDIDLCTNANPEQQKQIYIANNIKHVDTGLAHGTWTAVINSIPYEITSLRIEKNHDGRHAEVEYTNDWNLDLERRDLTINAMAMTFSNELIDPFNGYQDLINKNIRFVGDPNKRIREDNLRILRWFRFLGRFGEKDVFDQASINAIKENKSGLEMISRERVWSEFSKIISGRHNLEMINLINKLEIYKHIDFYEISSSNFSNFFFMNNKTKNPISLLVFLLEDQNKFKELCINWKFSKDEMNLGNFIYDFIESKRDFDVNYIKSTLVIKKIYRPLLVELSNLFGNKHLTDFINNFNIPTFPLNGNVIIEKLNIQKGPELGIVIEHLKDEWLKSNFKLDADQLLEISRSEIIKSFKSCNKMS
jgi:tRNA nucleotidyltransferase (CCA-adding enzyme)